MSDLTSTAPHPPLPPAVDVHDGLTDAQVAARVAEGHGNGSPAPVGRSIGQIIRTNLVTRFNLLLGGLFGAAIAVRAVKDTLFIWVVVVNLAVGVIQEIRARRALARLTVVADAPVRVKRNAELVTIAAPQIVRDDVLFLGRGEQVPVDGIVVHASGLEVDESLVTGESHPLVRVEGDTVLSGSVVVAGSGLVRATAVGDQAYARSLSNQARQFTLAGSELRAGTDRILRAVTWSIVPTGLLLLWSQLVANESVASAVQGTIAGVSAMVPEGRAGLRPPSTNEVHQRIMTSCAPR